MPILLFYVNYVTFTLMYVPCKLCHSDYWTMRTFIWRACYSICLIKHLKEYSQKGDVIKKKNRWCSKKSKEWRCSTSLSRPETVIHSATDIGEIDVFFFLLSSIANVIQTLDLASRTWPDLIEVTREKLIFECNTNSYWKIVHVTLLNKKTCLVQTN